MAEVGVTLKTGSAAAAAGEGAGTTVPPASRTASAKSVKDYITGSTVSASRLRPEGEAFVSAIVDEANKLGLDLRVTKIQNSRYEARVFASGNNCVVFIFNDTYVREQARTPTSATIPSLVQQMRLRGITEKIIQVRVIYKESYDRPERAVASLVNTFRAKDDVTFKDLQIGDYNASGELHVNMNLKDTLAFAEGLCDGPVAAGDFGFILSAKTRDPNLASMYGQDNVEITNIGGVTMYTDIKRVPTDIYRTQFKYIPTVVITGIYSRIRTDEMAAVLSVIGADIAINRGLWRNSFATVAGGERNLGNLFAPDRKTGKRFEVTSPMDREAIIQQHFYTTTPPTVTPLLAIDLQEGADQFPGLKDILGNPDKFKAAIANFTHDNSILNYEITQGETVQYDGVVETPKGLMDTRAVDYLFLVDPKGGNISPERVASFLDYPDPNDPRAIEKRIIQLEEFYTKMDIMYTTRRVFFNPDFIRACGAAIAQHVNFQFDSVLAAQTYDISQLKPFTPTGAAFVPAGYNAGAMGGYRGFAY